MANLGKPLSSPSSSFGRRYFTLLFLPGAGLIMLAAILFYLYQEKQLENHLSQNSTVTLTGVSARIQSRIEHIGDELLLLAGDNSLINYLDSPTSANKAMLSKSWMHFMQRKQIFDQIRWLDNQGSERLRIDLANGKAAQLPDSVLQDKSARYYFQKSRDLKAGEIYLSRLDLNIEQGKIEQPIKPTLRFITPIFSSDGTRYGYLVLNYLADDILQPLRCLDNPLWLINSEGYWLNGPSAELEWGFMYQKPENRLVSQFPAAWQAIRQQGTTRFRVKSGLWNVQSLNPLDQRMLIGHTSLPLLHGTSANSDVPGQNWSLIQFVPAVSLYKQMSGKRALIVVSSLGVVICWLLICWRLSWVQRALQIQRRETEAAQTETETFLEQSPDPMLAVDTTGRIHRFNQATVSYFGYSPEQLSQMQVDQLLPERFRASHKQLREGFGSNPKQRKMGHGEFLTALTANGEERSVSINLSHFVSNAGEHLFTATLHDVTQERQFQQELLRYRERLSLATCAAELGIWDWDMEQDQLYWDEGMHRIYGTRPESFTASYQAWFQSLHPDDREPAVANLETAIADPNQQDFFSEFRIIRQDGGVRHIRAHGRIVHNAEGKPVRIIGTNQDITQQKRTELALKTSESQLKQAQRLGQIGHWTLDLQDYQLNWSDEIFALFELDAGQFQPSYEAFLNMVHPADRERVNQAYNDSLNNRSPYVIRHRLQFADGRIKWVEERCRTEYSNQNEPLRSQGTVQDITQQKRAEERLQIAASVFTHAREAIFISDADNHIITANHAFEEITGYSLAEVVGRDPKVLGSEAPSDQTYQEMWEELRQQDHWCGEIHNRRKNGESYLAELTISCVRDNSGAVLRYVALLSDITQQRRQRQQLEYLAHHDPLTGLVNRVMLLAHLQQEMANSRRHGLELALAFVDLDGFKPVNDQFGHRVGDQVLEITAQRIRQVCRESDIVGRWGGDEFVILITSLQNRDDSTLLVNRLLEEMQQPFSVGDTDLTLSCSIGLAFYDTPDLSADQLLTRADQAMYQAKAAGKNRFCTFSDNT